MTHKRVLRVAEALRRELGFILDQKLGDRRVGMVTITRAELSDDMKYAKIYVSFLGDEDRSQSLRRLKHARRFLRSELAGRLDVRVVPELTFLLDDSSENYIRIAEVLRAIHDQDDDRLAEGESAGQGEEPEGAGGRAAGEPGVGRPNDAESPSETDAGAVEDDEHRGGSPYGGS